MIKQENNNYIVSRDTYGRYEFCPVDNFSHVTGQNQYFMDTTLYNDGSGNLIVEGKRLNGVLAGKYFPESIINKINGWHETEIDIDVANNYIENDNPLNKKAIKKELSKHKDYDWGVYLLDFKIEKEYFYHFGHAEFVAFYEDKFTKKQLIISDPYGVVIKD